MRTISGRQLMPSIGHTMVSYISQGSGADTGFLIGGVTKKYSYEYIVLRSKTGMRIMPILGGFGGMPPQEIFENYTL